MLLRSSSSPVLGSLLSSDNPNSTPHHDTPGRNTPNQIHHNHTSLSFHQTGSMNLSSYCNSSPISPTINTGTGFRRAQSEGNLEGLASGSCSNLDELSDSRLPQKPPRRPSCPKLQTVPSFSFFCSNGRGEDEENSEDEEIGVREGVKEAHAVWEGSDFEGVKISAAGGQGEFHLAKQKLDLVEESEIFNGFLNFKFQDIGEQANSQMYLAKGLGVAGGVGFGGGDYFGGLGHSTLQDFGKSGGDGSDPETEEYYRRMVEENPGNPLFLRNYAQFLYNTKHDLQKAEEYYSRAILADPTDGEVLSQYAKLTWELHRDEDRTLSYFERAVQAAPEDSHVHAAYASFLWEAEEDEDDDVTPKIHEAAPPFHHNRTLASASA